MMQNCSYEIRHIYGELQALIYGDVTNDIYEFMALYFASRLELWRCVFVVNRNCDFVVMRRISR
jgi:hypothetical protein